MRPVLRERLSAVRIDAAVVGTAPVQRRHRQEQKESSERGHRSRRALVARGKGGRVGEKREGKDPTRNPDHVTSEARPHKHARDGRIRHLRACP